MPGLVLSSAFCCLDLLLWSWYKYHTFSWTAYSWSTELKTEIKRGGVPSKHQDITEWKRSYFMLHYWFGSCTLVLFLWMIHGDYTCGLHEAGPVFLLWTFEKLWEEFHLRGDFKRDCNQSFSLTFLYIFNLSAGKWFTTVSFSDYLSETFVAWRLAETPWLATLSGICYLQTNISMFGVWEISDSREKYNMKLIPHWCKTNYIARNEPA